jgi:hypothetical protein
MLIEDLEKWARREGIETATEVTIRILGATDVATQFINLLRLLRAGKKFSTEVKVKTKASSPDLKLEITLETDEKGIEKPAVKILNNIAGWGLPGFEGSIKIGGDDIQIDEIKRQLKNTLGSGDSNIKVGLEIKPKKGENAV